MFAESEDVDESCFDSHSIKVAAESCGSSNLSDNGSEVLAESTTEIVKSIITCAIKFMMRGKRRKLFTEDIDRALILKNFPPLYGFSSDYFIPFRFASGGGRELFFGEDKEVELSEIIHSTSAKLPFDVSLKTHWLAIDGVQPLVPENPIITKDNESERKSQLGEAKSELSRLRQTEMINVRSLTTHDISVEQQVYFKAVTEGAVGSEEKRRTESLNSLSTDTGLQPLVPRIIVFIAEGVKCNVIQHNLAILIYLMRMSKALCENPTVSVEKCLHDLLPAILSCILGNQLCARPEVDNHWALREFAARVLIQVCKQYSNQINNLQVRLCALLTNCWKNDASSFATLFGAVYTLAEFGNDAIRHFILPKLPYESERLRQILETNLSVNPIERVGAEHLKNHLLKVLRQYIKANINEIAADLNEYRLKFGSYLGTTTYTMLFRPQEVRPPVTGFGTGVF